MAQRDVVREELWNIFTFYTIHGNPRDPSRMNASQFLKLLRDSQLFDESMVDKPLTKATFHLIYTAELKNIKRKPDGSETLTGRVSFSEFLSCLVKIALQCYPDNPNEDMAMQQLLMDNILPFSCRRMPASVKPYTEQREIVDLFNYYEEALVRLFRYYATAADNELKHKEFVKLRNPEASKSFDDLKLQNDEAKVRTQVL